MVKIVKTFRFLSNSYTSLYKDDFYNDFKCFYNVFIMALKLLCFRVLTVSHGLYPGIFLRYRETGKSLRCRDWAMNMIKV